MSTTKMTSPSLHFACLPLLLLLLLLYTFSCHAQQQYEDNHQLNCYATNGSSTLGYSCNSVRSCSSYLTFRSQAVYQSPVVIGYLLGVDPPDIARINGIDRDVSSIPEDQLLLVPVVCSCSSGGYYQHSVNYTLNSTDTYLIVANNTYQGLSTCQALMSQNPYDTRNLTGGFPLDVPLRCACPTAEQARSGVRYLLTYLVTWGDEVSAIADRFRTDHQAVLHANNLSSGSTIYPFTTLLVPLKTEPTKDEVASPPAAAAPPPSPSADVPPRDENGGSSSGEKWAFIGVGIGVGLLALCCAGGLMWWFWCRRRRAVPKLPVSKTTTESSAEYYSELSGKRSELPPNSVSVQSIRSAIGSLTVYEFRELEEATGAFGEDHRIMGSVYRGAIEGDAAAIKRVKGAADVSNEINILKQISHSNVIRLSGFCLHEGNTYLVYEFAENGSLGDWLHHHQNDKEEDGLSWKQRVQIAQDVAHGLNYLHNCTNPPYVHRNLKSSNILLDGELRAKVANFGLARPTAAAAAAEEDWETQTPHLTRHVVGTQGYMAPEYLEHGLVTPKLDVFAFGVVMLELLSGKEATFTKEEKEEGYSSSSLLWASIGTVMSGEDARSKLMAFIDPCLRGDYPLDLAYAMAELAMRCVARDPGPRPTMTEVIVSLSAIYNSTLDWDPSDLANSSSSMVHGR